MSMPAAGLLLSWFMIAIVVGAFTEKVASAKGYASLPWFAAGFLFNIVALVAAVGLPLKREADEVAEKSERDEDLIPTYDARTVDLEQVK